MNLNYPGGKAPCSKRDKTCLATYAHDYGYKAAQSAFAYALGQVGPSAVATTWWLDIETTNTWNSSTSLNVQVIAGAIAYLAAQGGVTAGVYSTPYQWGIIAGTYAPGVPDWSAGAPASNPASYCSRSFGGGQVWLTQYANGSYDGDYSCP
jgi:hypothetical protein